MTNRLSLLLVFAFGLSLPVPLCASGPWHDQLTRNRTVWDTSSIANYEFTLVQHRAWSPLPPMRIVVRNGLVHSAHVDCDYLQSQRTSASFDCSKCDCSKLSTEELEYESKTIPQLFDIVASRQKGDPEAEIEITFHRKYGFPIRFSLDNPRGFDEEYGFEISKFHIAR